jgi:hypothetical protein
MDRVAKRGRSLGQKTFPTMTQVKAKYFFSAIMKSRLETETEGKKLTPPNDEVKLQPDNQ